MENFTKAWTDEDIKDKSLATKLTSATMVGSVLVGKAPQFDDLTMLCLDFRKKYKKPKGSKKRKRWRGLDNPSKWIPEAYREGAMKESDWH